MDINMNQPSNPFFKIGNIIDDKWVIVEMIGKGGMAEVYRAHQLNLKRDVAIKVVSEEMLQSLEDDEQEIETAFGRFQREVQAMAQVRHENILQVFDYGTLKLQQDNQDRPLEYIVMEYIPGDTLRYTMSEEGFDEEAELTKTWLENYFIPLLDGVEVIHNHGIVHRDIKPENVLMDGDIPKIADFGLARSFRMKAVSNSWDIKGTLAYMAPEQFSDFRRAGKTADMYALGKILYEAVTGTLDPKSLPFKSAKLENPETSFFKHMDSIIQTVTSEESEARFQTINEFRKAILTALDVLHSDNLMQDKDAFPQSFLINNHKWIWAGITITILLLLAMTVWHIIGKSDKSIDKIEITENGHIAEEQISIETTKTSDSILGKDGIKMMLVEERKIDILSNDGSTQKLSTVKVLPFYIDKTKVTNHHFAEFLNYVHKELSVQNGVVKKGQEIWFYLGSGKEPFEQIIFEHGRFHLRDPGQGGLPIFRVTFYGAMAYAKYYGKRLLSENEWRAVAGKQNKENVRKIVKSPNSDSTGMSHDQMMNLNNENTGSNNKNKTEQFKTGAIKISVPADMGGKIKEWVIAPLTSKKSKTDELDKNNKVISRVIGYSSSESKLITSLRYPWEGFPDVGFRTAVNVENVDHVE
jgi:serine/threonine protein kinase